MPRRDTTRLPTRALIAAAAIVVLTGGPDGGATTCPNGSVATPGYASGTPSAPAVGCTTP